MKHFNLRHTFSFDGRIVAWDRWGSGPPLVVVHGTPWSSFNMRHLIDAFQTTHTVYAYDLVGYGSSSKAPGDVSLGVQHRLLAELLRYWRLVDDANVPRESAPDGTARSNAAPHHHEQPILVGHDFGGATVLRTHLLGGIAAKAIVLIDAVAIGPWGSGFYRHVKDHQDAYVGMPPFIHEAVVRAYVSNAAHDPLDPHVLDRTVTPWLGDEGQAALYRQIVQNDDRFTREIEPRYGTMNTPTLIVWGEDDRWIPVERGRDLHTVIPGSRLAVIPQSGHLIVEERPDEVVTAVRAFLARTNTVG